MRMITRVPQLTMSELRRIDMLHQACKRVDGNCIPIYKHLIDKIHPISCNVLCQDDDELLGYLRTYFFYADACEVALMVAPQHRRQGIASALIQEIIPVLQQEQITSLIFSSPKELNNDWLTSLHFTYRNSEYQMQYDAQKPVTIKVKPAVLRPAVDSDIPILCAIDAACFPNKKVDPDALFQSLLRTPNCDLFVLTENDEVVGKAHLFTETDRIRLTDLGVLPKAQGQGFGAALVKHCLNHALVRNKTKIFLDVETTNERALKLYEGLGFSITNAHDYWVTPKDAPNYGLTSLMHHRAE